MEKNNLKESRQHGTYIVGKRESLESRGWCKVDDEQTMEEHEEISEHCACMRSALTRCRQLQSNIVSGDQRVRIHPKAASAACSLKRTTVTDVAIIPDLAQISPIEFRQRFLWANQPCLIQTVPYHFDRVAEAWRCKDNRIHREWFRETLGESHEVPVRLQPSSETELDSSGRAMECQTVSMTVGDWICELENNPDEQHYLKDWHLQKHLESNNKDSEPLYFVPPHFETDLLNAFLLQCTQGDYRFVYWGPAGSRTDLHSDVMNSFSWSYNVQGVKEWTFHVAKDETVKVRQKTGECVFVPAGLKHSVVNLEETLSINHNWVTTANIDLVLECMLDEINAIETELRGWDISDCEARENMLRGCFGLDVTSLCLMILTRGLTVLQTPTERSYATDFDLVRIREILDRLSSDKSIELEGRLSAAFSSERLGSIAIGLATKFMELTDPA